MPCAADFREPLSGPVPSIRTPFLANGDVDEAGLTRIVDFCLEAGAKSLMLTAGDSHYFCMDDAEIGRVTQIVCQRAQGKAMVIAADRQHSTDRAIAFARFARDAGAGVVMCLPPDWGRSCTEQTLAEHYAAVGAVLPVMMVTNLFIARGNEFGLGTVERTLELSDQVVAVKDDVGGDFAQRLCLLANDRMAVLAGGRKQNHLNMWPWGCTGYLSTFLTFRPAIAKTYWDAVGRSDLAIARSVIRDFEIPLFRLAMSMPGGFDAALHGLLELEGLAGRWRRKPYASLSDEHMQQLAALLQQIDRGYKSASLAGESGANSPEAR